jgi:hypothetical protein
MVMNLMLTRANTVSERRWKKAQRVFYRRQERLGGRTERGASVTIVVEVPPQRLPKIDREEPSGMGGKTITQTVDEKIAVQHLQAGRK